MYNYLLKIEYDGTNFVGWQSQKNGTSVQDKIEKNLKRFSKLKLRLMVLVEQIRITRSWTIC